MHFIGALLPNFTSRHKLISEYGTYRQHPGNLGKWENGKASIQKIRKKSQFYENFPQKTRSLLSLLNSLNISKKIKGQLRQFWVLFATNQIFFNFILKIYMCTMCVQTDWRQVWIWAFFRYASRGPIMKVYRPFHHHLLKTD